MCHIKLSCTPSDKHINRGPTGCHSSTLLRTRRGGAELRGAEAPWWLLISSFPCEARSKLVIWPPSLTHLGRNDSINKGAWKEKSCFFALPMSTHLFVRLTIRRCGGRYFWSAQERERAREREWRWHLEQVSRGNPRLAPAVLTWCICVIHTGFWALWQACTDWSHTTLWHALTALGF